VLTMNPRRLARIVLVVAAVVLLASLAVAAQGGLASASPGLPDTSVTASVAASVGTGAQR
jgi:hypothetical protein